MFRNWRTWTKILLDQQDFHTFSDALSLHGMKQKHFLSAFDFSADLPLQNKLVWTTIDTGDQCKLPQNSSESWSFVLQVHEDRLNLTIVCPLDFTHISQWYLWRPAEIMRPKNHPTPLVTIIVFVRQISFLFGWINHLNAAIFALT